MALPSSQDEIIRWILEMEAKAALAQLREIREEVEKTAGAGGFKKLEQSAKVFATQIALISKKQQKDWRAVLRELIAVDAQLTKMSGGKIQSAFAGITQQDISKIIQGKIALGDYKVTQDGVIQSTQRATATSRDYVRSIDAVRIALGAIVAMAVFRAIQFIEDSMRKAIQTAYEFEQSLYRLSNAERILSQEGVEVSFEGLKKGINEIKKLFPIFSKADITQEVSLIGIMTKELGYTEDQIVALAKAIGALNIRSAEQEDLLQTTNKVLTALVAPTGRGVPSLGIDLSEANQQAVAMSENFLKAGEGISKLTKQEKDLVKLKIVLESTGEEVLNISEYLESNSAKLDSNKAAWEDLLNSLGQLLLPFIPALTKLFEFVLHGLDSARFAVVAFGSTWVGVITAIRLALAGNIKDVQQFRDVLKDATEIAFGDLANKFFQEVPEGRGFSKLLEPYIKDTETATDKTKGLGDAIADLASVEGFDDLVDDLGKLQDKLEDLNDDFSIDQARAWEDYQVDIQRLIEDYAIKRQRIIEDTNEKIEDANQKHHNRQKDDEAKFQEQMRQLREKFLFNLEDALRERDARQVLRLQRQYQMDKTALENEHALRQQQQDTQHQEDLQRIRDDRDDRLRELAEEERIRLQREREDYELKKQREEEDHARDLEDLKEQINDRLMEFARAIGEEYDLNDEGVNAIYDLLQQYYGPNGLFDGLYDYSYKSMVARAQSMLSAINQIVAQAQTALALNPISSVFYGPGGRDVISLPPQAKGGTYLATRPTTATFGEAGPEIAQFIPLSKLKSGNGAGSVGGGNMSGLVEIDLLLSPDLEARIVRNTMNETAKVVTKVRRTK